MRCKVCGSETDKLKHGLCRPCFMVAGVESEEMKEALENDLPKKYHIPVYKASIYADGRRLSKKST